MLLYECVLQFHLHLKSLRRWIELHQVCPKLSNNAQYIYVFPHSPWFEMQFYEIRLIQLKSLLSL